MPKAEIYVLPSTVSRDTLLDDGSDQHFRELVSDLFTIASRMEIVRSYFGHRLGITGPQYSLIVAVARLQGKTGANVGTIAQALHVSSAFIATEAGKLVRRAFLLKRTNPLDRRSVLLSVAPAGRLKLGRINDEIRAINDQFFGSLDATTFAAMRLAASSLVKSSSRVMLSLSERKASPRAATKIAGHMTKIRHK